jgi:hypothetical protein
MNLGDFSSLPHREKRDQSVFYEAMFRKASIFSTAFSLYHLWTLAVGAARVIDK